MEINIVTTKFENVVTDEKPKFGYRIYDDMGRCSYDNTFFANEEDAKGEDDFQILHDILDNPSNDIIEDIIYDIEYNVDTCTVFVNGNEIEGESLKNCFPRP